MTIFQVLAELSVILSTYGPLLLKAEGFIRAGDWTGLVTWLESLLVPNPPVPAPPKAQLEPVIAGLKTAFRV